MKVHQYKNLKSGTFSFPLELPTISNELSHDMCSRLHPSKTALIVIIIIIAIIITLSHIILNIFHNVMTDKIIILKNV